MIKNRPPVLVRYEPFRASGPQACWVRRKSSPRREVTRGKRILLVEDQEPLRASLRMMLELDGHQVTEAGNGAEALSQFNRGKFDLVITDFEMPVMQGNQLAASLKLRAPSLPILMITASERARGEVENLVDALLNKPLTVPDLRCALEELLSARPALARPSAVLVAVPPDPVKLGAPE